MIYKNKNKKSGMNFDEKDFEVFLRINPVLVALTGRGQRLRQRLAAAVRRHSRGRCSLRHRSVGVGGFRLSLERQVASEQIKQDERKGLREGRINSQTTQTNVFQTIQN